MLKFAFLEVYGYTPYQQDFGFGVIPLCPNPPLPQFPLLHPIKLFPPSMSEGPSSPFFLRHHKLSMDDDVNVMLKIDTP